MQHEITIDGYVASGPHDLVQVAGALSEGRMSPECLSSFVFADEVVAQVEAARDARVLFVRVGGPGGSVEGSFRIYEALRRFAASGGRVVTYALPGRVASTATTLLLAGDVRFMHPDADLLIHSVIAAGGTELVDRGVCDEMNRRMLEVYTTRTTTPRAALEEALACTFDADKVLQARRIPVDAALAFRWVTFALAEATARSMAEQLAAPGELADVPAGAVGAREIRALSIEAGHIKADAMRTSNYAEDGNGFPTAGAKLDHQGTALKVAPGNLQLGAYTLADVGAVRVAGYLYYSSAGGSWAFDSAMSFGVASVTRVNDPSGLGYMLDVALTTPQPNLGPGVAAVLVSPWCSLTNANGRRYEVRLARRLISGTTLNGFRFAIIDPANGNVVDPNTAQSPPFEFAMFGKY